MRTPLIVAAMGALGIGQLFLLQGTPRSQLPMPSHTPILQSTSGPPADVIEWMIVVDQSTASVQAVLRSSATTVVPYFTDVRLTTMSRGTEVDCGPFPDPMMTDNGVSRIWMYTMTQPTSGSCASADLAGMGATGIRDGVRTKALRK